MADSQPRPRPVRAPSGVLQWLEQRVLFEAGALAAASPILRRLGRGDRHPVLVLPGFTAGDLSTQVLRSHIRSWGYWVHGWRLGRNLGPTPRVVDGLQQRLLELHERHGRKVSLVGWSLGGIYSRELARAYPDAVRQVITLGSPFRLVPARDRSTISRLADRLIPDIPVSPYAAMSEEDRPPVPVPTTAIFSRTDGIVRWHLCIDAEGPRRENVEVRGSHSGLGFNPAVLVVIGDRLRQAEGEWSPFRPPAPLRGLYPAPVWWHDSYEREGASTPA